ncbi:MAG: signal peptidase I [Bacteroidota bacterium]
MSTPTQTKKKAAREREAARAKRKAEREAARNGKAGAKGGKRKEGWKETLRFWGWAILIVLVVRAFLVEPFRIPTPSMEDTLLVGDFLFVSKVHYGARTPNTICVPFIGKPCLPGVELPQTRLPGFSEVKRGDVAVFNYPPETGPIERRTPYIKRLVGMPGDTVRLLDKVLYVGGERYLLSETQQQWWEVSPSGNAGVPRARVEEAGADLLGPVPNTNRVIVTATPQAAEALRALPYVASVEGYAFPEGQRTDGIFPAGSGFNRDNYGPLAVPKAGETVALTAASWPVLREVITRHEGHQAEALADGRFRIDGEIADSYTFAQDYYFAMGDNRDNSQDSRFWGFVPHDHLVGKAVLVFFSLDTERFFLPRLRGLQPIR